LYWVDPAAFGAADEYVKLVETGSVMVGDHLIMGVGELVGFDPTEITVVRRDAPVDPIVIVRAFARGRKVTLRGRDITGVSPEGNGVFSLMGEMSRIETGIDFVVDIENDPHDVRLVQSWLDVNR
jgi:hypothetical protein